MEHTRITEQIWCGGQLRSGDWERLYREGVRADLSLQAEARDVFGALTPQAELWVPAADWHMPTLDQLSLAAGFIHLAVQQGLQILVHCKEGIGRAPLTVACYLITRGMGTEEAIQFVRARRPIVAPNPNQVAVVREFERQCRMRNAE